MTIYGWITLIGAVGMVTLFLIWCFYKAFTLPDETKKLHGYGAAEEPTWADISANKNHKNS